MHFNKGKSKDCSQLICIIDFFIYSFFHSFVTSIYIYCCSGLIFHPLRIKPSKDKQVYRWSRLLKELWDDDEKRYFSSRLTNIIFDPIHVLCIAFDAVILIQDLILFWTLGGGRGAGIPNKAFDTLLLIWCPTPLHGVHVSDFFCHFSQKC